MHLPPGYFDDDSSRYPVLYLQDGQNLFDPSTAFGGQEWRVDETADGLVLDGAIEPVIIVGIYTAGSKRIEEYTGSKDPNVGEGGKADLYGKMLIEELRPMINSTYRTLHDAQHTGVGGSSLGALVSLALGLKYPTIFGKVAAMSPSVWWHDRIILRDVAQFQGKLRPQIWLDIGTAEGNDPEKTIRDSRELRDALISRGWSEGQNLKYYEDDGAGHNERAWGARVAPMLTFLFPNRK